MTTEKCSNHEFQLNNYLGQARGRVIWKVMRKSASRDIASWRIKKRAVAQSVNSLLGRPPLQEGGTGNGWRIFQSVLGHRLEVLVFGQNWKTRYSLVPEQTRMRCHKMDSSL